MMAELTNCAPQLGLPVGSEAFNGTLTIGLWRTLMPDHQLPSLRDRVHSLTLSFEATDFADPPQWNFCQDSALPSVDRASAILGGAECYNRTDPCSMLTWGPRGATAGQGAELQWILWKVSREAPALIVQAFGSESDNVTRFVRLKRPPATSCDGSSALEHFMCAAWIDPQRRASWEAGLLELGRSDKARMVYRNLYAADEFDGYKMRQYFELWRRAGIEPSEIDYAFFIDRATHSGSPPDQGTPELARFRGCLAQDRSAATRNAAARRCLAMSQPHAFQPVDRLGRDVAYYRAQFPEAALSEREHTTWSRHIPLDATVNFAMSDNRLAPPDVLNTHALPPADRPPESATSLTAAEHACPLRIRRPLRPPPP